MNLAPRIRVPVGVLELRCRRQHRILPDHLRPRLHERGFFFRCDYTYGSGDRCGAWCHIQPVGIAWLQVIDVTQEQAARFRPHVFDPEYIARRVVQEYRAALRRRAG